MSEALLALSTNIVIAVAILIAGWIGGNWANRQIRKIKKIDETLKSFIGMGARYTILALAAITVLQQFGVQTASLLAVLGAAGLAIGLALQGTLSNVAAGVMLLFLRPFNVGDTITCGAVTGTVKTLGLFATELATPENIYIFVPNSNLWNADIQNFSKNRERRQDITVGIGYSDDIALAMKTMEETLKNDPRILQTVDRKPAVMVTSLGDFAIGLTARFWTGTDDFWSCKVDLTRTMKENLDKAGISIPYPTRTIELHNPQGEQGKSPKQAA